ncbi:hypothetical protein [Streptomyces sp. NPDC046939]|uniref:hypothetical protein n=1 Tax=Streptomyces sp. NPDC046939 TaxID=3155376 RepID=UPI003409EA8D
MDARQARDLHADRLLQLANVNGVATGKDEHSGADVIVVFVVRKVPRDRLRAHDVIPDELEGVPVRVLAVGGLSAQDGAGDEP